MLVFQLNSTGADIFGALIMKLIAWICFFDFKINHMPGKKHTVADGLSRRGVIPVEMKKQAKEKNIDDFIDTQLNFLWVSLLPRCASFSSLIHKYTSAPIARLLPFWPANHPKHCFNYIFQSNSSNQDSSFSFFSIFIPPFLLLSPAIIIAAATICFKTKKRKSRADLPRVQEKKNNKSNKWVKIDGKNIEGIIPSSPTIFIPETTAPNSLSTDLAYKLVLKSKYGESLNCIAIYLTMLQKLLGVTQKEFRNFKNHALHFRVLERYLFRRNSQKVPCQRVIDYKKDKITILKSLHDKSGHQGGEKTYWQVADCY